MTVKLKLLRKERGWTQKKAAEELGISLDYVKKIEACGNIPSIKVLQKIAVTFGRKTIDELFKNAV